LLALAGAAAAAPLARAEVRIYTALDFSFEDGSVLPELHVAYETHGTLSPGRDNAVLLVHGASGDLRAFDALIGPGKTFDTDMYFVITADAIGGGGSSSPRDGLGQDFPRYTIRDIMAALYALVTRGLGLATLRVAGGLSMGSFVALEWGVHHPETVRSLILLLPSDTTEAGFQLTIDVMTSVIALDADWEGGRYSRNPVEGLRRAGMLYYPWSVSAEHIDRLLPSRLAAEVEEAAGRFADWDANSLVLRYAASRAHDISAPYAGDMNTALARVAAPALIVPSASDRLLGLGGARRLRDGLKRRVYAEIPTDRGHRAGSAPPGTPEGDFIDRQIRGFLATVK
jgi:homoserine O-acetyltransferase